MFIERKITKNYTLFCLGFMYYSIRLEGLSINETWKFLDYRSLDKELDIPLNVESSPRVFQEYVYEVLGREVDFSIVDSGPCRDLLSFGYYRTLNILPSILEYTKKIFRLYNIEKRKIESAKDLNCLEFELFKDNYYIYWCHFLLKKISKHNGVDVSELFLKELEQVSKTIYNRNFVLSRGSIPYQDKIKKKKNSIFSRTKPPTINSLRILFSRKRKERLPNTKSTRGNAIITPTFSSSLEDIYTINKETQSLLLLIAKLKTELGHISNTKYGNPFKKTF